LLKVKNKPSSSEGEGGGVVSPGQDLNKFSDLDTGVGQRDSLI